MMQERGMDGLTVHDGSEAGVHKLGGQEHVGWLQAAAAEAHDVGVVQAAQDVNLLIQRLHATV